MLALIRNGGEDGGEGEYISLFYISGLLPSAHLSLMLSRCYDWIHLPSSTYKKLLFLSLPFYWILFNWRRLQLCVTQKVKLCNLRLMDNI